MKNYGHRGGCCLPFNHYSKNIFQNTVNPRELTLRVAGKGTRTLKENEKVSRLLVVRVNGVLLYFLPQNLFTFSKYFAVYQGKLKFVLAGNLHIADDIKGVFLFEAVVWLCRLRITCEDFHHFLKLCTASKRYKLYRHSLHVDINTVYQLYQYPQKSSKSVNNTWIRRIN